MEASMVLGGDLNVTRFPFEKFGGSHYDALMGKFPIIISQQGLIDVPLRGAPFTWSTWSNKQEQSTLSRINHFLISADWEGRFGQLVQEALQKHCIGSFADCVVQYGAQGGPNPFRFELMWLEVLGFMDMVK